MLGDLMMWVGRQDPVEVFYFASLVSLGSAGWAHLIIQRSMR